MKKSKKNANIINKKNKEFSLIDFHIHTPVSFDVDSNLTIKNLLEKFQEKSKKLGHCACVAFTDHENSGAYQIAKDIMQKDEEKFDKVKLISGIEVSVSTQKYDFFYKNKNIAVINGKKIQETLCNVKNSAYSTFHMLGLNFDANDKNITTFSKLNYLEMSCDNSNYQSNCNVGKKILCCIKDMERRKGEFLDFALFEKLTTLNDYQEIRKQIVTIFKNNTGMAEDEIQVVVNKSLPEIMFPDSTINSHAKIDIIKFVEMIKKAGGTVGIAHPKTIMYKGKKILAHQFEERLNDIYNMIEKHSTCGNIEFIELYKRFKTSQRFDVVEKFAKDKGLFVTGASDFHGTREKTNLFEKVSLGKFEAYNALVDVFKNDVKVLKEIKMLYNKLSNEELMAQYNLISPKKITNKNEMTKKFIRMANLKVKKAQIAKLNKEIKTVDIYVKYTEAIRNYDKKVLLGTNFANTRTGEILRNADSRSISAITMVQNPFADYLFGKKNIKNKFDINFYNEATKTYFKGSDINPSTQEEIINIPKTSNFTNDNSELNCVSNNASERIQKEVDDVVIKKYNQKSSLNNIKKQKRNKRENDKSFAKRKEQIKDIMFEEMTK